MEKFFLGLIVVAILITAIVVRLEVANAPSFYQGQSTRIPISSSKPEPNIIVTEPVSNQKVTKFISVNGKARVFESQFNYKLLDSRDKVVTSGQVMAKAPDVGQYGIFTIQIDIPASASGALTLQVFDYSAKDGSVIDLVSIPLLRQ